MKFCCGREKKEPFFPKSRLPQRSFCVMLRNVLHLLGKLTEAFLCRQKRNYFISIIYCLRYRSTDGFSAYPKKEEGRNE